MSGENRRAGAAGVQALWLEAAGESKGVSGAIDYRMAGRGESRRDGRGRVCTVAESSAEKCRWGARGDGGCACCGRGLKNEGRERRREALTFGLAWSWSASSRHPCTSRPALHQTRCCALGQVACARIKRATAANRQKTALSMVLFNETKPESCLSTM